MGENPWNAPDRIIDCGSVIYLIGLDSLFTGHSEGLHAKRLNPNERGIKK